MMDVNEATKPAKRARRMAREPKPTIAGAKTEATPVAAKVSKPASKASLVPRLLQRSEGATISQLAAATGWLPHTTRAALTGLKKKGHTVTSNKAPDEDRVYHAAAS